MPSRAQQPNAADAVPGVRRRRYGINRQPAVVEPDARTSSFWPALELLGIDPKPQLELGGHVTPGGPPPPPQTCATCYELNVETGKCERIANCEEDDNGNIITTTDDTETGQCHGMAEWNSVSSQCECPTGYEWGSEYVETPGTATLECVPIGTPKCEEPGYVRIDGTCVPDPNRECKAEDVDYVNTCKSHGYGSASPPQYSNRNGTCYEEGCNKEEPPDGITPEPSNYKCADGRLNTQYANGRCPEEREHPPGAPFGGDPDSGPDAPLGDYTPVGTESEDRCSDPAFALLWPSLCGKTAIRPDVQKAVCERRGGTWDSKHNVCTRVRRRSRSGPDQTHQTPANIPGDPNLQGGWG